MVGRRPPELHIDEPDDLVDVSLAALSAPPPPSQLRRALRVARSNRLAVVSAVVLTFIVLFCYLGPLVYHTNQTNAYAALFQPQNLPPSVHHLFGTDNNGWDILGRIMYGGQYSLSLGFFAGLITIIIGTAYGLISGYAGGAFDSVMMRVLDACLSIPYLFLLIALVAIFHNSTTFLIIVIGTTLWWGNARIIRGDALQIRELEYSQAAAAMGSGRLRVIRSHILPNSISNIVTVGTFSVADAILFLSALGFLGLGIQPPATDWGTMLNQGVFLLPDGDWWEVFPVTTVFVLVIICINFIGDALRDAFEVRLRDR
jgi:peptide/nickel transport system permease protein